MIPQYLKSFLVKSISYNPSFLIYYIVEYICLLFQVISPSMIEQVYLLSVPQLQQSFTQYMESYHLYSSYQQYAPPDHSSFNSPSSSSPAFNSSAMSMYYMYYLLILKLDLSHMFNLYSIQDLFYSYYSAYAYNQSVDLIFSLLSMLSLKYAYHSNSSFQKYLIQNPPKPQYIDPQTQLIMLNPVQLSSGYITDKASLYIYMLHSTVDPLHHQSIQSQSICPHLQLRKEIQYYLLQNPKEWIVFVLFGIETKCKE